MDAIKIAKSTFQTNFNQVEYSTFAILKPPITTPEVGVNKFTIPEPAQNTIIITSGDKPNVFVNGAKIGIDTAAKPEDDGIKKDKPM